MNIQTIVMKNGEFINFDSYMIPEDLGLESGQLRLLEVDNRVVVPIRTHIRLIDYFSRCYYIVGLTFIRC